MKADYDGTRLGRQELNGELIEELEGALWTRAMLEECRVASMPCVITNPSGTINPACRMRFDQGTVG
jgi:phage terminase large subunit-like protein